MDQAQRIRELEQSHAELRGALIFAGRRIQRLTRYRIDREPSLPMLRNVLRNARGVARSVIPALRQLEGEHLESPYVTKYAF